MTPVDASREFRRHRVGRLAAASNKPVSVAPTDPISVAVTLMLQHDYSQLPVLQGERTVKGLVSWKSIGKQRSMGAEPKLAQDAMTRAQEVSAADSLFDAIPLIARDDAVLVRDERNVIVGIVTAFDVSLELQRFGEPFWRLEDLESYLRAILESRIAPDDLLLRQRVRRGDDPPASVDQLTFGEYVEVLSRPEWWDRLESNLDRGTFLQGLTRANSIRNAMMHFRNDDLDGPDREFLVKFSRFVGRLARPRV